MHLFLTRITSIMLGNVYVHVHAVFTFKLPCIFTKDNMNLACV